jgi:hypothetical protein
MELTDDAFDLALISRRQLDESQPATVTAKLATLSTHRSAKKATNFPPFDFGARFLCYAEWKAWSGQMSGDDFLDGLRAARAGLIRHRNRLQSGRLVISDSPIDPGILSDMVQAALLQGAINSISLAIKSYGKPDARRP